MHLLWESEPWEWPLHLEVLLAVSGATKLLTQACRSEQGWEMISIHARATGLSLYDLGIAASDGCTMLAHLGRCKGLKEENPTINHWGTQQ